MEWRDIFPKARFWRKRKDVLTTGASGRAAQDFALKYLLGMGLKLIASNVADGRGELDLVMLDGATGWVVVEVRSFDLRSVRRPHDVLPVSKQKQVTLTARRLLQRKLNWKPTDGLRFDAVLVELDSTGRPQSCQHNINAWWAAERGWKPI